jgi:predicted transcriptional regulator
MSWEDYSFVIASTYRRRILLALESDPKTPTQIALETKIHKGNVSKILGELRKKELVECITPDVRKARLYRLTTKGKEVVRKIKMTK